MKDEINSAVKFILKLIKQNSNINEESLIKFQTGLKYYLAQKFSNHWHPERPWQGQGYRCLRINGTNGKETTIARAAADCGLKYSDLKLPLELTVWVDPNEVCCRFGEHKGSYCTIASFQKGKKSYYNDDIDIMNMPETSCSEETSNKGYSRNVSSPKPVSKAHLSSMKENIVPPSFIASAHNNFSPSKLKPLIDPLSPSNRMHSNLFTANLPIVYTDPDVKTPTQESDTLYSPMERTSPYMRPNSWIGYPLSVSPPETTFSPPQTPFSSPQTPFSSPQTPFSSPQTPFTSSQTLFTSAQIPFSSPQTPFSSSCYYSYSSQYSSQDNLNFSHVSPVNMPRMRWNSSESFAGNAYHRNGWYVPKQMNRV